MEPYKDNFEYLDDQFEKLELIKKDSLFDRDAKSVTVDFQTAEKSHNSLTVVSLAGEGCMTVQNNIFVTVNTCDEEAKRWIDNYKKRVSR